MQITRVFLAAAAALLALPAHSILIRADRDDAEYLEMATRYESSVLLGAPDGEGVLIAPRWMITAAHVAKALQEMKPLPKLTFADEAYEIQAITLHPNWKPGTAQADLAVILLRKSVKGVTPTPLYRETDELGKTVVIVGHGESGIIGEKALPKERWDRKKRAAVNTVERVAPSVLGLQIKRPDEASDLQGAATPGDSGGPAFIETPAGLFVAGIGSATEDANGNRIVGDPGDWELYVRVSTFVPWIEAVILDQTKRELESMLDPDRR
jgi:hypothetical protein